MIEIQFYKYKNLKNGGPQKYLIGSPLLKTQSKNNLGFKLELLGHFLTSFVVISSLLTFFSPLKEEKAVMGTIYWDMQNKCFLF